MKKYELSVKKAKEENYIELGSAGINYCAPLNLNRDGPKIPSSIPPKKELTSLLNN